MKNGACLKGLLEYSLRLRREFTMKLAYAIKYVADMNRAVKFYRDVLGLPLKFESPEWSELVTGETTLALHAATTRHSPGAVELGFTVADMQNSYQDLSAKGVRFSRPTPKRGLSW